MNESLSDTQQAPVRLGIAGDGKEIMTNNNKALSNAKSERRI